MSLPAVLLVAALLAPTPDVHFVSRASGAGGAAADDNSVNASVSADGRFVAFASFADNLSDEDNDVVRNVYVRDRQSGTTTFVSRASGATGEAGDGFSNAPSISADGRFVAFTTEAGNLSDADAEDNTPDVFVRDLRTGTTTFVSRANGVNGAGADASSDEASISADGRFVAFHSVASNLGDGSATPTFRDIFVRDLQAATTTFVSRASGDAGEPGDAASIDPTISADGRFVAFQSYAANFSDSDVDVIPDIFVRDLEAETTTFVSRADGVAGAGGDGVSSAPSVSGDGHLVAFASDAENLDDADEDPSPGIFVRDLQASTTNVVSGAVHGGARHASIAVGGRFVAFEQEVNDTTGEPQPGQNIFVHDLLANTTKFVARASAEDGEPETLQFSFPPSISSDGRVVAFESEANSLSGEDDDTLRNVYARDLVGTPSPAPPRPAEPAPPRDTSGPIILTRANRRIHVSRAGRFRLFCGRFAEPVTGTCGGRGIHRKLELRSRSFTAPAGRRVKLGFRLSRGGLRTLAKLGRVRMGGTVTARDALGNATTARFRFVLKRAR